MKPLARYLEDAGMSVDQLAASTGLEPKLVQAIASGNYTPSPNERQRLAAALGVSIEDVAWGHAVPVEHMWGHGPQFGRTP
jgi:ribosome-binding protein aMBF1 (putative translation factor)